MKVDHSTVVPVDVYHTVFGDAVVVPWCYSQVPGKPTLLLEGYRPAFFTAASVDAD